MNNDELQSLRALTRDFVREFELIKDNKFELPLTHFLRHLLLEIDLNPNLGTIELSKILVTDKSNLSRGIKALISDGYLIENFHPTDRRKKLLSLSKEGKKVVKIVNKYSNERLKKALVHLPKKEFDKITEGLTIINNALRSSRQEL